MYPGIGIGKGEESQRKGSCRTTEVKSLRRSFYFSLGYERSGRPASPRVDGGESSKRKKFGV